MRSASRAAILLALLTAALAAAGSAAISGSGAVPAGDGEMPLLANISLPDRTVAAEVWYERGFAFTGEGRYADAVSAFQNALSADPSHLNAWYYLGDTLFRLGRYEEALLAFQNATEVDPDFVEAYFSESRVYGKLGMPGEEKEALARGLDAAERVQARDRGEVPGTTPLPETVPQPVPVAIPLLGAVTAAALLGYRGGGRGS
jgi:tetratricopeptide (TPR) repeat protein